MQVRRVAAVVALGVAVAGAYAPAAAAPKKKPPITKTYDLRLVPVPDPPQGTTCLRKELEGLSIDTQVIKPTGPGILNVKVSGFRGDWDITVLDDSHTEIGSGSGTTTPTGAAIQAEGEDTLTLKFKKAQTIKISICNFAGTPIAKASYEYKYV